MAAKSKSLIFSLTCIMFEGKKERGHHNDAGATTCKVISYYTNIKSRVTYEEQAGTEFSTLSYLTDAEKYFFHSAVITSQGFMKDGHILACLSSDLRMNHTKLYLILFKVEIDTFIA